MDDGTEQTDTPTANPAVPSAECRRTAAGMILSHTTILSQATQVDAAIAAIDKLASYLNDGTKP
jgi:hypothetical protein